MSWLRFLGKVLVIVIVTVPLTILALLYLSKKGQSRGDVLRGIAVEAKESLDEAKHTAVLESRTARNNELRLKRRLRHIRCIGDKRKRREELLRLFEETSDA